MSLYALQYFGERAEPSLPKLQKLYEDPRYKVGVLSLLVKLGLKGLPLVSLVEKGLFHHDEVVRRSAIYAVAGLGEHADPLLPRLMSIAKSPEDEEANSSVAFSVLAKLIDRPGVLDFFKAVLRDGESRSFFNAIFGVDELKDRAVPLIPILLSHYSEGKYFSIVSIPSMGKAALPYLIRALKEVKLRAGALAALGKMGEEAAGAVPTLVEMLDAGVWSVLPDMQGPSAIVETLVSIGKPSVPYLVKILPHPGAVQALKDLGENAEGALPFLLDALQSDYIPSVEIAIEIIASMGEKADAAAPYLLEKFRTWPEYSVEILTVLSRLGEKGAKALVQITNEYDPESSWIALEFLGVMGKYALPYVPMFLERMTTRYPSQVNRRISWALNYGLGSIALPFLMESLRSEDPEIVGASLTSLLPLGYGATPAIPALADLLRRNPNFLIEVSKVFRVTHGPGTPQLLQLLKDPHPLVRKAARNGLKAITEDWAID